MVHNAPALERTDQQLLKLFLLQDTQFTQAEIITLCSLGSRKM
jgi:hypothetical protein